MRGRPGVHADLAEGTALTNGAPVAILEAASVLRRVAGLLLPSLTCDAFLTVRLIAEH